MTRPVELAHEVIGRGRPVLLLHGLFASGASWRAIAHGLADRHRVYSVDLRNHGRSPRCSSMSYTEMADDVLRLIEAQSLGPVDLVGHSIGGKVAMALALAAPWAVDRLVVVDIAPAAHLAEWATQLRTLRDAIGGADGVVAQALRSGAGLGSEAGPDPWSLLLPRAATRNAFVDWRTNVGAVGLALPELCDFPRLLRYLRHERPLHVLLGEHSRCVQPAGAEAFAPMFPDTRIDTVPQAGHWPHAERPEALLARLRRVLSPRRQAPSPRTSTLP